ncbi:hypothetical protein [Saccharopolyspora shandongensis]|uniref:hypothetical protein n=1 Tax=Saccharopolyspora shandongensis TaxID=418495 RepID=UPI0033D4BBE5
MDDPRPLISRPLRLPAGCSGTIPYLFGAIVIQVHLAVRRLPAHAVRLPPSSLLWVPLMLVVASASVLAAELIRHQLGRPGGTRHGPEAGRQHLPPPRSRPLRCGSWCARVLHESAYRLVSQEIPVPPSAPVDRTEF